MSDRIAKVNSLLEHEIGKILLRDFAFNPNILVTLTHVDVTANLIEAKVYVSVFPEDKSPVILNALKKSTYDIQYKINRTLKMRPIPKLIFVEDKNERKAGRIEELLAKVKAEGEIEK